MRRNRNSLSPAHTATGAALLLLLTGCSVQEAHQRLQQLGDQIQSGQVLALRGLQGRWGGPVAPTDPTCGPTTHGLMTVGVDGFGFDPFQSTTVIQGKVDADGHLSGKLLRPGVNQQQGLSISFEGAPQGAGDSQTIVGTLQSARCQWKVTLSRS